MIVQASLAAHLSKLLPLSVLSVKDFHTTNNVYVYWLLLASNKRKGMLLKHLLHNISKATNTEVRYMHLPTVMNVNNMST